MPLTSTNNPAQLATLIRTWGAELGFQQLGITETHLEEDAARLQSWLNQGMHGEMDYMQRHGSKRTHPEELVPGTVRVISVRMDYLPEEGINPITLLEQPDASLESLYYD